MEHNGDLLVLATLLPFAVQQTKLKHLHIMKELGLIGTLCKNFA